MKQNAALEMFEYLKEHLIPLAKDKGDKVYESDTTVQIARPENKSVWDCEKEVKQLLSKIGAYSASVKNSINCVIINYSQTAQAVYIGFFVADRVTYEYIEERSFNTLWAVRASFEIRHLRRLSLGSADPSEYSRS